MLKKRSDKKERELTSKQRERRNVMIGAGKAAAMGAVVAAFGSGLSSEASAAAAAKPVRCMTILYKNGPDVHFDFEYYRIHHITDIMRMYGKSIQKFELRKGLPGADGAAPLYVATITIWIADDAAFDAAGAKYGSTLAAEVPKFTNTQLVAQRDEIYAVATS